MAEIKSTMELVLERAARIGKATSDEMQHETNVKTGMQITAEYLNEKIPSLKEALNSQDKDIQPAIRKGMLTSLLRNIFLPREEEGTARVNLTLKGIQDLGDTADLGAVCGEIQNISGQYGQHRKQLYEQLKEQMRMQLEQLIAQQTGMPPDGLNIDPTTEPKFKEEWGKIETELDGQYGRALEQYKDQLNQIIGS